MQIEPRVAPSIAIIDDDSSFRGAVSGLLRSMGFGVKSFASGDDFLCWHQEAVACLILDYVMPGENGLQVLVRLRALGYQFPVIFTTAHDDEQWRQQAFKAGAFAILTKPLREEKLSAALRAALGG